MTANSDQTATGLRPDSGATAAEAIEDLYRAHGLGLVRLAVMLVGDQPTAEDVVQEAFLSLYRGWHRVRDHATVVGYLRTSVINGARSALRGRGRRNALLLRAAQHDPPVWSAEAAAIDGEDRRALMAAVARLTQRQREVLALKYYVGLGENEIAALSEEFTASADGSTLAYLTYQCNGASATGTEILGVVRNGTTRDWTVPSSSAPGSLSLSADGSELGYVDTTNTARRGTASVLATSSPSGSLARWSRPVFVPVRHGQQAESLVLSPDGQTAYLLTAPADQPIGNLNEYAAPFFPYQLVSSVYVRVPVNVQVQDTLFSRVPADV